MCIKTYLSFWCDVFKLLIITLFCKRFVNSLCIYTQSLSIVKVVGQSCLSVWCMNTMPRNHHGNPILMYYQQLLIYPCFGLSKILLYCNFGLFFIIESFLENITVFVIFEYIFCLSHLKTNGIPSKLSDSSLKKQNSSEYVYPNSKIQTDNLYNSLYLCTNKHFLNFDLYTYH